MLKISTLLASYRTGESGATAIEYGLIAAGIAMAIAVAVFGFGDTINSLLYGDLTSAITPP